MFNEFDDKLNIKLVLWPKNLVFSFLDSIYTGKKLKLMPRSEFINIDTTDIISSDVESKY